jgi:hypothetical protein
MPAKDDASDNVSASEESTLFNTLNILCGIMVLLHRIRDQAFLRNTYLDTTYLFFTLLFNVIGVGFFSYGRKQSVASFMLAGIGLLVYPYFINGVGMLVGIGSFLVIAPILWTWFGRH